MNAPARHPLLDPAITAAIEQAARAHLGRPWLRQGFTSLDERSSHPAGIFHGEPLSIFAKLGPSQLPFATELAGLRLLSRRARISTPIPIADGLVDLAHRDHLQPGLASRAQPAAGTEITSPTFGLSQAAGVARIAERLPELAGPDPHPSLLHGDAQQHNFVSTPAGAVAIDACPYFGHPEIDLAQLGFFQPVPAEVFAGYRDVTPIDPGFPDRQELWRLPTCLAVIAVDPDAAPYLSWLAHAVCRYA